MDSQHFRIKILQQLKCSKDKLKLNFPVHQLLLLALLPKYLLLGEFMLLQCSFRTFSFLFIVSVDPTRLHASAYFAISVSVFLLPLPPTNIDGEGL